jgi:glycosyltransferase involved in cell wall biosynthesis
MRVLIIEPDASGHHATYLRWLVQAADQRRWSSVIACNRSTLSHPSLSTITCEFNGVHIHLIGSDATDGAPTGSLRLILREFGYWRLFKRIVDEVSTTTLIDAVILPYIDYCFYAIAVLGSPIRSLPWSAISMRLSVTQEATEKVGKLPWKWRLARRILQQPNLKSLFVINPSVRMIPSNWYSHELLSKVHYLRDPSEFTPSGSKVEARRILGIFDAALVILVFGSIDERKAVDSLFAGLEQQANPSNSVVVLAGRQSSSMRDLMGGTPYDRLKNEKRLIVLDRFIDSADQNLVLMAADVVWVGYRNHFYMSGVMVLAGKAGLPVVGTAEGEIGRLIVEYRLGTAVNIDNPGEVAQAMNAMLDDVLRMEIGQRARQVFADHTVENFGTNVLMAFDDLPKRR